MTDNKKQVLIWFKDFKTKWLPQQIPNDKDLVELITNKIFEIENLIFENPEDENTFNEEEYHRARLLNDHSSSNSDTEQVVVASTSIQQAAPLANSLPTPPDAHQHLDNQNEEEQSKQILLEESDSSDVEHNKSSDEENTSSRPSIPLKRISKADAERYMPPAWKNVNLNSRKNSQGKNKSSNSDETASDSNASQNLTRSKTRHLSNNNLSTSSDDNTRQSKRKLPILDDDDQMNSSSKTLKGNETSTTTSSTSDDDFKIKLRTRKSLLNKSENSPIKLRKHTSTTTTRKSNDVIITYNQSNTIPEPSLDDSLSIVEDLVPMDEDRVLQDVIENNDNESIFASLDMTQEKPIEHNSHDNVEDISNDGMDIPSHDSNDDRPSIQVPSYSYLLNHSKSSSDSNSESLRNNVKNKLSLNDKNQMNNTKRLIQSSSSNSDTSQVKKKTKGPIKQRVALTALSSSSDDSDDTLYSTAQENVSSIPKEPSPTGRIQIQRSSSSSEDSNNSDEVSKKRTRQRRKKANVSSERSSILKQIKRKTKEKKSSVSTENDDSGDNNKKTKKSKHKLSDDDDESTTDDDEEKSPRKRNSDPHGRKNIRKIIADKELDVQTKEAIEAERERRKRIAEKQKEYNDTLLDQSSYMSTTINDEELTIASANHRLILELDKTTNEPLIEVSPKLVEQLKPHQCDGIRFLWNNVFESIDVIKNKKNNGNGCILAHCMGLGKTLQVISFIHTIFNYDKITNVRTCLVLCPINAALNWTNEFEYWLKDIEPPVDHYQLTTVKPNLRVSHLNYWYENGGVAIMGYELYRRLANGFGIKNKKLKAQAYRCLVDPGPDIVVADEGHILKNAQTALAKCLSKIKTPRRIVLTGTPLQNNLIEYFCMVSFIKPNLLGSQQEYINRFVNPIQNGQHRDSNDDDVRLMKRRACVLHELLTGFIDRKDYSLLKEYLPPKFEYIINIRLSDLQSTLYEIYLKRQVNQEQRLGVLRKDFKSAKLFADYQYLQKIWTHPFLLYPHFIDHWKKRLNKDDESFIDDHEFEAMFIDEDDDMEGDKNKNKKSNEKDIKSQLEHSFSGFLIDNIKNEGDETNPTSSKSTKRRTSNTSTTTINSDSSGNHDDVIEAIDSDSQSKKSDDDIEIIKTYPTRSRTVENPQQSSKISSNRTTNSNIFDTGNDQIPVQQDNNDNPAEEEEADEPWLDEMKEQFWFPFLDMLPDESKFDIELSGKFLLLKSIIDKCIEIGDKILLFSRSLYTLNYIEKFLNNMQIHNEKEYLKQCESRRELREILSSNGSNDVVTNEYIPEPIQWKRDLDYFRMDGQTDVTARKRYAKAFNDLSNIRARLFLISTLAGGIGINLTGSNRVIVFDASWNPSHDTQAIFRSYRFGQKKPVYIYRFLAHGTMEEKIYQRQVVKQSLSQRVVDDHQLDRHFTENDIKELYKFKPEQLPEAQSTATLLSELNTNFNYPIPKDHLLLDLLCEHNRWIHSYHSHDSLLENKLDEGLSTEERRKALEEYENLKHLPDQRQIALQRFQQQQQLNALIAQQQQLASTTTTTTTATRVPHHTIQQFYADIIQSTPPEQRHNLDYATMLQYAYDMGFGRELTNNQRTTNTNKFLHKRVQKPTMNHVNGAGPVAIQPRPTIANTTTTNPNVVIIVESDEETNNNNNIPTASE